MRVVCHSQGNRVHSIGLLLGHRTLNQLDMEAAKDSKAIFEVQTVKIPEYLETYCMLLSNFKISVT